MSLLNANLGDDGGATITEPNTGEGANESTPSWWIDDGIPGTGERPDWLPEKYKTAKDVANAYKSLEQRLGVAPDKYDWETGKDWLDPDYEPFQEMAEFARSKHVPQDVMDKMLGAVGKYLNEFKIDYTEERQKLGEKAEERLTGLDNWMKANFSDNAYKALANELKTAESIQALEELREKMINNNTTIPGGLEGLDTSTPTIEDIEQEMADNFEKYSKDKSYRDQIRAKLERAAGGEKK